MSEKKKLFGHVAHLGHGLNLIFFSIDLLHNLNSIYIKKKLTTVYFGSKKQVMFN